MKRDLFADMKPLADRFAQQFGIDIWEVIWRHVEPTAEMYAFILQNVYEVSEEVNRDALIRTVEGADFPYDPTRLLGYAESGDWRVRFNVGEALRHSNPEKRDVVSAWLLRMLRDDPYNSSPLVLAAVKYCPADEVEAAVLGGFPEILAIDAEDVLDGLARVGTNHSLETLQEWRTQLPSLEPLFLAIVAAAWEHDVRKGYARLSKEKFFERELRSKRRTTERALDRAIRKLERKIGRARAAIPDSVRNLPAIPEDSLPEKILLPVSEVRRAGDKVVVSVLAAYGPHAVGLTLELPWRAAGEVRFVRTGDESDAFAQVLSDATGVPARPRLRDEIVFSGVLVDGSLGDPGTTRAMWKATHESPYCELLIEFDGTKMELRLLEKDADFRTPLVRTFAR